jgi:hypothetical protein
VTATDPLEQASLIIAGIEPLGGARPQVRVIYSGTWDTPLFVTVGLSDSGADLSVVDPGEDFARLIRAVFAGEAASPSPSRRESRAALLPQSLGELSAMLAAPWPWRLADGELRGNDGHWITVDVHAPGRGAHRARDWCPAGRPVGDAAAVVLRAAATGFAELGDREWVQALWRAAPPRRAARIIARCANIAVVDLGGRRVASVSLSADQVPGEVRDTWIAIDPDEIRELDFDPATLAVDDCDSGYCGNFGPRQGEVPRSAARLFQQLELGPPPRWRAAGGHYCMSCSMPPR